MTLEIDMLEQFQKCLKNCDPELVQHPKNPIFILYIALFFQMTRSRRGHMVVGFTTTCAIGAYHH